MFKESWLNLDGKPVSNWIGMPFVLYVMYATVDFTFDWINALI